MLETSFNRARESLARPCSADMNVQREARIIRSKGNGARGEEVDRKLSAVLISHQDTSTNTSMLGTANDGSNHLRYLPLCPSPGASGYFDGGNASFLTILPSHRDRILRSETDQTQSNASWPLNELPVELFDLITAQLARDDVKTMRLVNQEFEQKVSRSLFHTAVVPFNTELYDMIDEDKKASNRTTRPTNKGKGRMKTMSQDAVETPPGMDAGGLVWQNAKEDKEGKVYKGHGLRVFQGFGPHIKRFGMSFEVSEKQLCKPPVKKDLDHVETYYGTYDWPSTQYARFASLAGLESIADETSRMKAAFSNLQIVQDLALSVDSGLGWLSGPDKSVRGRIFERPSAVFGNAYEVPDRAMQAANEYWTSLQQSQWSFDPDSNPKEMNLEHRVLPFSPAQLDGLRGKVYSDTQLWSDIDVGKVGPPISSVCTPGFGVFYTTATQVLAVDSPCSKSPLTPNDLSKEQKEWLLETQWAQQAFLESYTLAIIDNPRTFERVTTMNIAKISSCFLPMLARKAFWDALPTLSEVVLHASPDWRTVEKDDAGFADTSRQNPSEAVRLFYKEILRDRILPRESIKKLNIGWFGGGEHAEGMFARNTNILPAPITSLEHSTANSSVFGLVFKHVEHLTLHNCWITPPTLEGLIKSHVGQALKKVTLDSVSLTAHPRFAANAQGGQAQQIAQIVAAQLANNPPQPNQQVPGAAAPANANQLHQQLHQQWAQQVQQMQQMLLAYQPNMTNATVNAQVAAMQNVGPPPAVLVAPGQPQPPALNAPNPNAPAQAAGHWTDGHREGSWPQVLNSISPGPVFTDYLPPPASWEEPLPPRPEKTLQTIELKSCGYARLPNHQGMDQSALEPNVMRTRIMSAWFRARYACMKMSMMSTSDRNIGQIIQYLPLREAYALQFAWGITQGWEDRSKAEEAEYDGLMPGGTGRFSGAVEKGMALVGAPQISLASVGG